MPQAPACFFFFLSTVFFLNETSVTNKGSNIKYSHPSPFFWGQVLNFCADCRRWRTVSQTDHKTPGRSWRSSGSLQTWIRATAQTIPAASHRGRRSCFIYFPSLIPVGASASHAQLINHPAPPCQSATLRSIFLTSSSAKTPVPEIEKKKKKISSKKRKCYLPLWLSHSLFFCQTTVTHANTSYSKIGNQRAFLKAKAP